MATLPTRFAWLLAATSGAWSAVLLVLEWPGRWPLPLVVGCAFAAATWVGCRRAWAGALLTATGTLVLGLLGAPPENAAPLAPAMIALVCAGYLLPWRAGIWTVPVLLGSMGAAAGWDGPSLVFGGVLLLLPWTFGATVRARDSRRRLAAAEASRLATVDPVVHARAAALAEREEVARSALSTVDRAVGRMRTAARDARAELDRPTVQSIHEAGSEAARELRSLLLVLREDPDRPGADATASVPHTATSAASPERRRSRLAWAGLAWPAVLLVMDVALNPILMVLAGESARPAWPSLLMLVLVVLPVAAAVVLRAAYPLASLAGTGAVVLLGWAVGLVDVEREGLWLAIAGAALSWSAGRAGSRATFLGWLALTGVVVTLHALDSPDNLPIHLAMHLLPYAAGGAWAGHHAAEAMHLDAARLRRAEIEAAERTAVSQARLQLARDLHDAASHAVGSMMMQANAALVLSRRDPVAARAALDAVVEIGTEAAQELRSVSGESDGPAGAAGPSSETVAAEELAETLRSLVSAARRAGCPVTSDVRTTTGLAREDLSLLLRVVREGLGNASRHAPGSDVRIEVDVTHSATCARVTNGPRRARAGTGADTGSGLGLRGLGEQLALRGGHLEAGGVDGDPRSGWELLATFPTSPLPAPSIAAQDAPAPQEVNP